MEMLRHISLVRSEMLTKAAKYFTL